MAIGKCLSKWGNFVAKPDTSPPFLLIHVNFNVDLKLSYFLFLAITFFSSTGTVAQDAVVDLTHVDFEQPGMHPISGKWQFYWNRLLTPEDFGYRNQQGELICVPGGWNRLTEYPALGFATYRMRVKLP